MITLLDAAKQALEALEMQLHGAGSIIHSKMACDALSAAIQEAEQQEPVAWLFDTNQESLLPHQLEHPQFENRPELYTALYTQPPAAKEWQGLTGEEIVKLPSYFKTDIRLNDAKKLFASAVEAKLKEKNT